MTTEDKKILEIYMQGFKDELYGRWENLFDDPIYERAYSIGKIDAIVGDDMPSNDYRGDDEILKIIKS